MDDKIREALEAKVKALGLGRQPNGERPPGFLQRAVSFAGAATRHVLHGLPVVSDEEKERRLAICAECPNYTASGTCAICTCPLKRKAAWALEHCPLPQPKW